MDSDRVFRMIPAVLFVAVIGTRRYFERKAAGVVEGGLVLDREARAQIVLQRALLTLSNLAMIAHLVNPGWMAWSTLSLPAWASLVFSCRGAVTQTCRKYPVPSV